MNTYPHQVRFRCISSRYKIVGIDSLYNVCRNFMPIDADEPITEKVRSVVEKHEAQQDALRYRRESDRWDYRVRLATSVLTGALTMAVGGLGTWMFDVRDTVNRHEIFITQFSADLKGVVGDIKELFVYKNNAAAVEKMVNGQIENFSVRLSDQDKRQQMQGEGLIAGNRSIHEALEKLMLITSEVSSMDRRVSILERNERERVEGRRK